MVGERGGDPDAGTVARAEQIQLARPPDPAEHARNDRHGDISVTQDRVLSEDARRLYEQVMAQFQDNFASQAASQELRKLKK